MKCWSINTLAALCTSLFGIGCEGQNLLKLSSAMSRYQFPLTVSDIDTKLFSYIFCQGWQVFSGPDWHTLFLDYTSITSSSMEPQFQPCWEQEESSEKRIQCSFQSSMSSQITLMTETPHFLDQRCWDTYPPYFFDMIPVSCLGEHQHFVFHLEHCRIEYGTIYQDF